MNSVGEIRRLRRKYETRTEDGKQVKPNFLGKIARMKGYYDGETKSYRFHETAMDYLQHSLNAYRVPYKPTEFLPFSALLVQNGYEQSSVKYPQVERVLSFVRDMRGKIQKVWDGNDDGLDNSEKAILVNEIRVLFCKKQSINRLLLVE